MKANILKSVYTANQCTDINDVTIALDQCINIYKMIGCMNAPLASRIKSLEEKGKQFIPEFKYFDWMNGRKQETVCF